MTVRLPVVIVTRCGIGVFDMEWWEARLALFRAVTLPSILNATREFELTWFLLLDEDMPPQALSVLREFINEVGGEEVIRLTFVRSSAEMNKAGLNAIRSVAGDTERVLAMRIDDDDAVSSDAIVAAQEQLTNYEKPAVITLPEGYAFNAPEQELGEFEYASNTSNTVYYGRVEELRKVLWGNHTKTFANARRSGFAAHSFKDGRRFFLYTYHRQGDGSYENRVSKIERWRGLDQSDARRFGIDIAALDRWVELQSQTRPTVGLTWRRTMPEVEQLRQLYAESGRLKARMVRTNSSIFDASVPFIYLNEPLPAPRKVPRGRVKFSGVATPGARVSLSATGRSGKFTQLAEAAADPSSGEFSLHASFSPAQWTVRLQVVLDSAAESVKDWDFSLQVT